MRGWTTERPTGPSELRGALYEGALLRLPVVSAAEALVARSQEALRAELGEAPREAHRHLHAGELFTRLGRVRRLLYLDEGVHQLLFELLRQHGQDPGDWAFDPARLRVVHPRGEEVAAAQAVYAIHRDTWYGHPSGLLTWWIPLDDLPATETFELWPQHLAQPVPNDSEVFDYDEWVARGWSLKIGWQDPEAGRLARYPAYQGSREALGEGVGFSCKRAESLLFAGTHLHGTRTHVGALTRFSLDFRLVHLPDHAAGRGAPLVDVRCRGSALPDYLRVDSARWGNGA